MSKFWEDFWDGAKVILIYCLYAALLFTLVVITGYCASQVAPWTLAITIPGSVLIFAAATGLLVALSRRA